MDADTRDRARKEPALTVNATASSWLTLRRRAASAVVVAVTPYLLIKVAWTAGLFLPTAQMGESGWRAINAATAALAAAAIVLAMAFSRPWGERVPAWLVALPVWVATGLLVPVVLLAPVLGPAAVARDQEAGAAEVWSHEQVLVMVSLVGVGIGLPLALVGYARARWPWAFSGTVGAGRGHTQQLRTTLARLAAGGALALGLTKVYWASGGVLGLDADRLHLRDEWWHLLSLSTGVWAVLGAWGLLVTTTCRGASRFVVPMAAVWTSSSVMFAQNLYSALSATRADAQPAPEHPLALVLTTDAGLVLGALMVTVLLFVLHDRRIALRGRDATTAPIPPARPDPTGTT